jgi:hypothetical protein
MQLWQLTDGGIAEMELGRVGMTWMWFSLNYDSSAVVEWNSLLNTVQVSVVLGAFASLAEWHQLDFILPRSVMAVHIQTALRTWQQQHISVLSKPWESTKREQSVAMMLALLEAIEMPSKA